MSLRLMLIRHAKAEPYADSGRDFDRELSRKGRLQAECLNAWLQQRMRNENTDAWQAQYSPAVRTQQTAELLLRGLDHLDRTADERIWNAELMDLTAVLHDCETPGIILIGHNPGMEQLVMKFTSQLCPVATGSVTEIAFVEGFQQGQLVSQFRAEIDST